MKILLTNDDGIQSMGLRDLYAALKGAGHEVQVVAPVAEMSAVGHAITFATPLRTKRFEEDGFLGTGVYGTPADCVKLGLCCLLEEKPDLVVSGINFGANVGVDIVYSGTVSAATEGVLMGVPSLATSIDEFNPESLADQAGYVADLVARIEWGEIPPKTLLNLNFPKCSIAESNGLVVCAHTRASYTDWYDERMDPRGRPYYWLEGEIQSERVSPDRDRALLWDGCITLTPLRFDFNDFETLDHLKGRFEKG